MVNAATNDSAAYRHDIRITADELAKNSDASNMPLFSPQRMKRNILFETAYGKRIRMLRMIVDGRRIDGQTRRREDNSWA